MKKNYILSGIAVLLVFFIVLSPVANAAILIKGSTGAEVKTLQEDLNKLGYNLDVDGNFGPATDKAVRDFQEKKGLAVDGSYGPATQAALKEALAKLTDPTPNTLPLYSTVLTKGSTGTEVKTLQQDLNKLGYNLDVDGSFGPATDKAVRDFQKKNELAVDGSVGPATQAALKEKLAKVPTPTTNNSQIKLTGFNPPTTIEMGKSYSLKGTMSSGSTISKVRITIKNDSGSIELSAEATNNSSGFAMSAIDSKVKFGSLKTGSKTLELFATNALGEQLIGRYNFEIKEIPTNKLGEFSITYPLAKKYSVTSWFGPRKPPTVGASANHAGIDFGCPSGTSVLSAAKGTVYFTGEDDSRGKYVIIKHDNNYYSQYQHLSEILCKKKDDVKAGDEIAKSGNTGIGSGAHLHFQVMKGGVGNSYAVNINDCFK